MVKNRIVPLGILILYIISMIPQNVMREVYYTTDVSIRVITGKARIGIYISNITLHRCQIYLYMRSTVYASSLGTHCDRSLIHYEKF